jgi:hypothetical protein
MQAGGGFSTAVDIWRNLPLATDRSWGVWGWVAGGEGGQKSKNRKVKIFFWLISVKTIKLSWGSFFKNGNDFISYTYVTFITF